MVEQNTLDNREQENTDRQKQQRERGRGKRGNGGIKESEERREGLPRRPAAETLADGWRDLVTGD